MARHRVTLTTVIEFDVDPDAYETDDPQERAEIDREAYDEDPGLALSDEDATHTVTVEILDA